MTLFFIQTDSYVLSRKKTCILLFLVKGNSSYFNML